MKNIEYIRSLINRDTVRLAELLINERAAGNSGVIRYDLLKFNGGVCYETPDGEVFTKRLDALEHTVDWLKAGSGDEANDERYVPFEPNKYSLTFADLSKIRVNDPSALHIFGWRNTMTNAWCVSRDSGNDGLFGPADTFYMEFYDDGHVYASFTSGEGTESYSFGAFYDEKYIRSESDMRIQEEALIILNSMLDEGVISVESASSMAA